MSMQGQLQYDFVSNMILFLRFAPHTQNKITKFRRGFWTGLLYNTLLRAPLPSNTNNEANTKIYTPHRSSSNPIIHEANFSDNTLTQCLTRNQYYKFTQCVERISFRAIRHIIDDNKICVYKSNTERQPRVRVVQFDKV